MKRIIALIVGSVLTAVFALYVQGYLAFPSLSSMEQAAAVGPDGTLWLSWSAPAKSGIAWELYGVNSQGIVKERYPIPAADGFQELELVKGLTAGEREVFVLTRRMNRSTGATTGWGIMAIDRETKASRTIAEAGIELFSESYDLTYAKGTLYVSARMEKEPGFAAVYAILNPSSAEEADHALTLLSLLPIPEGETVKSAVYDGNVFYLATGDGDVGRFTAGGYETMRKAAEPGQYCMLIKGRGGVWCLDQLRNRLTPAGGGEEGGIMLPQGLEVKAACMMDPRKCVILGGPTGGITTLSWLDAVSSRQLTELKPSAEVAFALARPYIPRTVGGIAGCIAILAAIWWIYGRNGRISLKLSFLCLAASMLQGGVWAWFVSLSGVPPSQHRRLMAAGLAVTVCLCFALSVFVEALTRPLRSLKRYMDRVSSGNYHIVKGVRSHDEVSDVWAAMSAMCQSLETSRRRRESALRSYYRFVPRDLEKLFGKDGITQVRAGEVREVSATVGLVTMLNRDTLRLQMSDEEYMEFMKDFFVLLEDAYGRGGGILSSGELNLSGIRVLFPQQDEQALFFGIRFLTRFREHMEQSSLSCGMEPFVLVHHTSSLCGLAGTSEHVLPFFVSNEMEALLSYVERFRTLNTAMVMTGEALEASGRGYSTRYIGYLHGESEEKRYELYEVLDAYPAEEQQRKERLREAFREALTLYHQGDFYLARNQFYAILKECPKDGIARWYLFASETYFHMEDDKTTDRSLFSLSGKAGDGYECSD